MPSEAKSDLRNKAALAIFALLVTAAPLLFGAVDRWWQIWLVALMGVGMILAPPRAPRMSPMAWKIFLVWIALLVAKEFAPWKWFGRAQWRATLTQSFDIALPWTHNPSPALALDLMLVIAIGALWFLWARSLASEPDNRPVMLWSMFASAGITAIVCLVTIHPANRHSIFNLRPDNDWAGFGPFPNRNHTACFLAMGVLLGCGCLVNAIRHKKQVRLVAAFLLLLVTFIALLLSRSRGGLIALVIGLGVYALLIICKTRSRKAVLSVAGAALVFAILCLAFGGPVLSRFNKPGEGEIPTNLRWQIWANTLTMWKDAPLFGHGLGTFPQVFPLYQTLNLEEATVGHPESSWLLWLVELGAIPLLIAAGAGAVLITKNLRDAFNRKQGFFSRASAFAAVSVLIVHALFDVPAHRWGTAGFALAILAVACPFSLREEKKFIVHRRIALVPLATAAFWLLPFVTDFPAWSPTSLAKATTPNLSRASGSRLETVLRYFPLNAPLHFCVGIYQLAGTGDAKSGWEHFRIADRLVPDSWYYPAVEAQASQRVSPWMALHFWSLAIERAGHRREEVFFMAWNSMAAFAPAQSFWSSYVDANPQLLLSYPRVAADADGRYYYQRWWAERAPANDLAQYEIDDFYNAVSKYGSRANLSEWMANHPALEEADYKKWAELLHFWKDDTDAWKLLSRRTSEPVYPPGANTEKREAMESKWFSEPENFINAQMLARLYASTGEQAKEREVIAAAASEEKAPPWFLQKAAFLQAAAGHYDEAVADLLRVQ